MADTRVQLEVEDWVRCEWMPTNRGQQFFRERLPLSSGGVFDFDAISQDKSLAAVISTSTARTSGGNYAVGKMMKIRSDIYFLLLANVKHRLVLLTDCSMFEQWKKEQANGRVPASIEFCHVELPQELEQRLTSARRKASEEVRPRR